MSSILRAFCIAIVLSSSESTCRLSKTASVQRFNSFHMDRDPVTASRFTSGRDAPGQQCKYIMPGEPSREAYRLYTFSSFPTSPVDVCDLASAGFLYTGFNDRTKCFSCGSNVERWQEGDDPSDSQWHLSDCHMVRGQEPRNVQSDSSQLRNMIKNLKRQAAQNVNGNFSLDSHRHTRRNQETLANIDETPMETSQSSLASIDENGRLPFITFANITDSEHEAMLRRMTLSSEKERRKTFTKWPTYPTPYLPSTLAKNGFFYLGNLDRVQCFSCSGVLRNWAPEDDVVAQHRQHFSRCRMAVGHDPRNIAMSDPERLHEDEEDRRRLENILSNSNTREPADPSPAEQRHLSVYLPCENPINPHMESLQRRIESFYSWPRNKTRATPEQIAKAGFFYLGESDKTKCYYCNGGLQNWDFNDEPWTEHAKWFPGCEFILRKKGVSFVQRLNADHPNLNRPHIRNPISFQDIPLYNEGQSEPGSSGLHNEEEMQIGAASMHQDPEPITPVPSPQFGFGQIQGLPAIEANEFPQLLEGGDESDQSLLEDLREMENILTCRICKKEKTGAIVLPCAHLCACQKCVVNMKKCAVCGSKVKEFMKVYRA